MGWESSTSLESGEQDIRPETTTLVVKPGLVALFFL